MLALQKHLISAMQPLLAEDLRGAYSFVPFDAAYPFVRIAEMHVTPWPRTGQNGFILENSITVYTNDKSNKTILELAAKVQIQLLKSEFSDANFTIVKKAISTMHVKQTAELKIWCAELQLQNWVVQNV